MNDITALAQREKFEAWLEWAEALPRGYLKKRRTSDDAYHEPNTTDMWGAWQAASAEMVEAMEARDKQIADKNLELFKQSADIAELTLSRKNAWKQASAARNGFDEQYALREATEQRITELEKAATEPVAWTDEVELRDVEANGFAYLFTVNPITPHADPRRVIKLYTVPPAQESRTVKLPPRVDSSNVPFTAHTWNCCLDAVEKCLAAAGIQVIEGEQKNG